METPRVDFVNFEINISKSAAPTQLVELKIFKPGKPGHEYPIITQTGCCDWYCFPKISGKQIVTNSDEGILFFDLIKMLSFKKRNPSYDLQLFELIIIDKINLKLVDNLYQAFTDMFNTFYSIQSTKNDYEIFNYSSIKSSAPLKQLSFCYNKSVKVAPGLNPDFFIVEFSKIKIVIIKY
ncbi:MAG: hypothetical protein EOM59_15150 [Clostridia bacterium]|nr:hypothetical protein [Clostridia bacterium]